MKTTKEQLMMNAMGVGSYPELTEWFEKNDDQRTPAKAVMALENAIRAESSDEDGLTNDQRFAVARMILVEMTGFIIAESGTGLVDTVDFISNNPDAILAKHFEIKMTRVCE